MTNEQLKHFGKLGMHWGKKKSISEKLTSKKDKRIAKNEKLEGEIKKQEVKREKNTLSVKKYEMDIEKFATLHSLGLLSGGEKKKLAKYAKKMRKFKKKSWKNDARITKYKKKIERNIRKMACIDKKLSELKPESLNKAKAVISAAFK